MRLKKWMCVSVAVAMIVSMAGCGSQETSKEENKVTQQPENTVTEAPNNDVTKAPTEAPTETPTEAPEDVTPTEEPMPTQSVIDYSKYEPTHREYVRDDLGVVPIAITISKEGDAYEWYASYEDGSVATASMMLPYIDESDPAVSEGLLQNLQEYRIRVMRTANTFMTGAEIGIEEAVAAGNTENVLYFRHLADVIRSDSGCVSLLTKKEEYDGGVDFQSYYETVNFDTMTGDLIYLPDILSQKAMDNNFEYFTSLIKEQIDARGELDSELYFYDYIGELAEQGILAFTIGYYGITVYLNEGVIAPAKYGSFAVDFSFAKYTDLFNGAYTEAPTAYTTGGLNNSIRCDIDGDGLVEVVSIWENAAEGETGNSATIMITEGSFAGNNFSEEFAGIYATSGEENYAVVVHNTDGRNYLYFSTTVNEMKGIYDTYVFELKASGVTYVDCIRGNFSEVGDIISYFSFPTKTYPDPQDFVFRKTNELVNTVANLGNYHIGEDGSPVRHCDFVTIEFAETVTLKKDSEFVEVDIETGEIVGTKLLPAGALLITCRTDGASLLDFVWAEDGKGIVNVSENGDSSIDYEQVEYLYRALTDLYLEDGWINISTINGESLSEVFDGLSFE